MKKNIFVIVYFITPMFRSLLCCLVILLLRTNLYAQHVKEFEIPLSEVKFQNSKYNHIRLFDLRTDTTNYGAVQTGALNRYAKVIVKQPLSAQLNLCFNSAIDNTAHQGNLLLLLRQFSFAEMTGAVTEKGYYYLRAGLYKENAQKYEYITSIDTMVTLKSSIDVTKALLKTGAETLEGFISGNLLSEPAGTVYTHHDLLNLDSLEKSKVKVYNTSVYADGLYLTYKSFMDQKPDKQFIINGSDLNMFEIKAIDDKGKAQKVKKQNVYAIVFHGEPFIATKFDYYPLKKVNNDFIFTGKANGTANTGDVIIASAFLGIIGGLMASDGAVSTYDMKIDHVNGAFIKLKEIPDPVVTISKNEDY